MRTFYDSTTVSDLPDTGDGYLAYVDGLYANEAAVKARFPHKLVVGITVKGTPGVPICDTEPGNIGLPAAAAWAAGEVNAGRRPTLYYIWSSNDALRAEVAKRLGLLKRRRVNYFPAHYDGIRSLPSGCIGKQYRSPDGTGAGHVSGHYDVSCVADFWPGVDPKPATSWYRRELHRGMVGADVVALKRRLRAHGYGGFTVLSPLFGAGCERAVRAFQGAHHLTVDGVVGPQTARLLG